jgi:hypothetical protein
MHIFFYSCGSCNCTENRKTVVFGVLKVAPETRVVIGPSAKSCWMIGRLLARFLNLYRQLVPIDENCEGDL